MINLNGRTAIIVGSESGGFAAIGVGSVLAGQAIIQMAAGD